MNSKYVYTGRSANTSPFRRGGMQSGHAMVEDDYSEASGYRPGVSKSKHGCRLNRYTEEELASLNGPVIVIKEGTRN